MAQFIVSVKETDALGQTFIKERTVVYTTTELEAKVQGAAMLGVPQEAVVATAFGDTGMAPKAQVIGKQQP